MENKGLKQTQVVVAVRRFDIVAFQHGHFVPMKVQVPC